MSRVQMLRVFINERLTAAADEIFGVFEGVLMEYEEEIYHRKTKMDAALKPGKRTHPTDRLQSFDCEEEGEQQDWILGLDQQDPEPPHIQGSQTDAADNVPSPFVKIEDDGEEPRSSEPPAGTSSERTANDASDGQLLSSDCSEAETEGCYADWKTGEPQPGVDELSPERPEPGLASPAESSRGQNPSDHSPSSLWCKVCGVAFPHKMSLTRHVKAHPRDCGLCGKRLEPTESLQIHLAAHRKCHVCGKRFTSVTDVERHLSTHTGQKPFSCTICGKTFGWKDNMKVHMRTHTGDRPFSCPVCGKTFGQKGNLMKHMRGHTGERPYSCSFCGKGFIEKGNLQKHTRIHTGEKPYCCSSCGKCFNQMPHLKKHKCRTESSSSPADGDGLC